MTAEQIITISINGIVNFIILFFIIRSNTVVKERLKSQDDINLKMKSFMDIFSVDEMKKYVETKTERMKIELENNLSKMSKKAFLETESYFAEMLDKEVKNHVENFDLQYNEVCRNLFRFIVTLPKEERLKFVEEYLPMTKNIFIKFLNNEDLI